MIVPTEQRSEPMAVRPDTDAQSESPGRNSSRWRSSLVLPIAAVVVGIVVITVVTRPTPRGLDWVERQAPTGPVNLDSLVATDSGFALLSGVTDDGVLLWWSENGSVWSHRPLPGTPSRLATSGDLLVAYNGTEAAVLAFLDGAWEVREDVQFPDDMRMSQSPGRPGLVGGPEGFLMTSISGDVWWWDLEGSEMVVSNPEWGPGQTVDVPFESACRPPTRTSPDVPPLVATDTGFVALVSRNSQEPFGIWPVCEPRAWVSEDGRTWSAAPGVIGDEAYVYSAAWNGGRIVAVGGTGIGEPSVWSSQDGEQWELLETLDPGAEVDLYGVRAGGAGWVVLGQETETSRAVGWVSPDTSCWTPLPTDVDGDDAGVTASRVLLIDRVTYPDTWLTTTENQGFC
jgi:hypothetical protein